ncbi:MAG TPA: VWA domain-containing protein [Vicinamibacteria bacterium]|nr:VWA domain-containing protein [Vicinamibacteria bacterium]
MSTPAVASLLLLLGQTDVPPVRMREQVDVERVLLEARVVDARGQPIRGLRPEHFRVTLASQEATVESVFWVEGAEPPLAEAAVEAGVAPPAPAGRLVVFFFQKDLERSRIGGLMRMTREASALFDRLAPEDRAAVVSFDSHLKLWVDFTQDREVARRALEHSILFGGRPTVPRSFHPPALGPSFDRVAARRAATPETALRVLGEALQDVPGAKSLVFFGWGLGRFSATGVHPERDYEPARRALVEARTSVFTLDVTNADYHSLEVGLEQVSYDTGGFYVKTHLFQAQALRRLEGALAGHYVLVLEAPRLPPGRHPLRVRLGGREGTVLAPPSWERRGN